MSINNSVTFFGLPAARNRLGGCTCIYRMVREIGQLKISRDCARGNIQNIVREADVFFIVYPLSAVLWAPGYPQGHCSRINVYSNKVIRILNLEVIQSLFNAFPKDGGAGSGALNFAYFSERLLHPNSCVLVLKLILNWDGAVGTGVARILTLKGLCGITKKLYTFGDAEDVVNGADCFVARRSPVLTLFFCRQCK